MHTELEEVRICYAAYLEHCFADVVVTVVVAVTDAAAVTVTATAADVMAATDKI